MNERPAVSVLMAVYECGRYVEDAVSSLLRQSVSDIEIIVVCDKGSDETEEILRLIAARDGRVVLHVNETRLGFVRSLNVGLGLCRSEWIARADGDDVADERRLQRQLEAAAASPECSLVGMMVRFIGEGGDDRGGVRGYPLVHSDVVSCSTLMNPFWHTTVMFRKAAVKAVGGYDERIVDGAEDYDLWVRLIESGVRMKNILDVGAVVRLHEGSMTARWNRGFLHYCSVAQRAIEVHTGCTLEDSAVVAAVKLFGWCLPTSDGEVSVGIRALRLIRGHLRCRVTDGSDWFEERAVSGMMSNALQLVYVCPLASKRLLMESARWRARSLLRPFWWGVAARLVAPRWSNCVGRMRAVLRKRGETGRHPR